MSRLFTKNRLLIILGVLLHTLALAYGLFYIAWICLVPLFIAIQQKKGKKAFYAGAYYGFVFGCLALFWLPFTVLSLTQGTVAKAFFAGLLAFTVYTIFYGLLIWAFSILRGDKNHVFKNALLVSAIWTIADFLLSSISNGMPWFSMCIGNTLLGNLYAIQPAEYGGIALLGFVVVLINYLIAQYFLLKQWKKMLIPGGLVVAYIITGYFILSNFYKRWKPSEPPVTIALLNGNISHTEQWNKENGNILVKRLLSLNEEALSTHPDIVLWTESVVPWYYKANDDFLNVVLKNSDSAYQIIGMNTGIAHNELYNSAYCFSSNGNVIGRYDKRYLISMAEQPMSFLGQSILKNEEDAYFEPGEGNRVLATSKGKIGVLICNEVFVAGAARGAVEEGAEFLVSLASDALVAIAPSVVNQQFFRSRLRAVEVRKDIAISCNKGISGIIAASGEILDSERSDEGFIQNIDVNPNSFKVKHQFIKIGIVYFSIFTIAFFSFLNLLKTKKP